MSKPVMKNNVAVDDNMVAFHDNELRPSQIMAQIRQRIAQRRKEVGYITPTFPSFGELFVPQKPLDILYDPNLYHHLAVLNKIYTTVETEADVRSSPATRLPLLGRLWQFIRHHAHGLVLFYVNRVVSHQLNVNQYLVNVVNLMVLSHQEQQRQILRLQEELEALHDEKKTPG